MVSASIDTERFRAWLFGAFAGLAVLLAMAGVYGVTAFLAAQRTAEFGVRVALGASRRQVFSHVLGRAAALAVPGLAVGCALAFAGSRLLERMLGGQEAGGLATYSGVGVLVAVVVLAAAAVPARKASRVDPVAALRRG